MNIIQTLIIFVMTCGFIYLIQWLWSRKHLYRVAANLPGCFALPFIGNTYRFAIIKDENVFDTLFDLINYPGSPVRMWLGSKLTLVFSELSQVEKIVTSTILVNKSDVYEALGKLLGGGLITGNGPQWKRDRKLISPMLNLKFLDNNLNLIQGHVSKLIINLEKCVNIGTFNVFQNIHHCYFDIMADIILGTKYNTQSDKNINLSHAYEHIYLNLFQPIIKPWLKNEIFFSFTKHKEERDQYLNIIFSYLNKAMQESLDRADDNNLLDHLPIIDQLSRMIKDDPTMMSHSLFQDHLATLFTASEDTTSMIAAACCACLGMYPEYQEKAAQEIYEVFGDTPREVTFEDLPKLKYLEMCIKDVLRLAPIAPFMVRECKQDFQVGDIVIPAGCDVLIPIFNINRDPMQWEVPLHFYPDHFLPKAIAKRRPYAFLPFSAGPRGCVGKHLALTSLKIGLANVLQNFKIEANGKFTDLKFTIDVTLRPIGGYNVKLSRRVWK